MPNPKNTETKGSRDAAGDHPVTDFFSSLKRTFKAGDRSGASRLVRVTLLLALIAIPVIAVLGAGWGWFLWKAERYDLNDVTAMNERTWLIDRHGERIGHVSGHGENREMVSLEEVSPHFIAALLAREDSRFHSHGGVDWFGVLRAAVRNAREGEIVQGASTITMQLARNTWGMREKTLQRKLLEAALAHRLERELSKDEILEAYVNRIYFGSGLYGVERAAQGFFMKPAAELSLGESAMLAGIIRAPSAMSPFRDVASAYRQRDQVLERFVELGYIDRVTAGAEMKSRTFLRPGDERSAELSYVEQMAHEELSRFLSQDLIDQGGLRIHTTIDPDLQKEAERTLDEKLTAIELHDGFPHPPRADDDTEERLSQTDYVQGAVVVLENSSGDILAMVGGRDFGDSPFNRATSARRQLGSTFKPFVYAAAFDAGIKPGVMVSDAAISLPGGNGKTWRPQNSDGKFGGYSPAANGLIRSRNTMTIRLGNSVGVQSVLDLAARAHLIDTDNPPSPSPVTLLGTFEATPLQVAAAYTVFPNRGVYRRPQLIRRIEAADGTVLYHDSSGDDATPRVMSEAAAWTGSEVLAEIVRSGTAASAKKLGLDEIPGHGKTGTTNDYKDAWFAGYTDKITCTVWVGMDRPQPIMSRGYGSTLALPVWVDVIKAAENTALAATDPPPPPPAGYLPCDVCRDCGLMASAATRSSWHFTLPPHLAPANACVGRHIDQTTPMTSTPATPDPGSVRKKIHESADRLTSPIRRLGRRLFGR